MRMHTALPLAALVALGTLGCGRLSRDTSPVLANVGGKKVTETEYRALLRLVLKDDKKAEEAFQNPEMRERRNELLGNLAMMRAVNQLAAKEGLDKEPGTKMLLEQAAAQAYLQVMMERRAGAQVEPTEAQLHAIYDERLAVARSAGQDKDFPAFEAVKPQLKGMWQQQQQEEAKKALLQELKTKVPVTYAEGWKPAERM